MSKPYDLKVLDYLRNHRKIAELVKNIVRRIDPNAEVYLFGSTVTGKYTGASDIDILVITDNINKKHDIIVEVYKSTEAPIELHVVTHQQFQKWYKRFINEKELIKI